MTPVILLHGWGGTYEATFRAAGWESVLRAAGLEPVGIDLPGHAHRGASHDPNDYVDLAGDLAGRMPDTARHCIAFSLGAKLALELECRTPGRFDRLVLGGVGDNVFAPETAGTVLADALLNDPPPAELPAIVTSLLAYVDKGGADRRSLAAVVRRPHNPHHTAARLATAKADVLLVNGETDTAALPDGALCAALRCVERVILPGCDHVGLTDDRRFMTLAAQFLSR